MSREFYVPCTPYAYPIRSNLPNLGHRLRKLMKFKSQRSMGNEGTESAVTPKSNVIAMASINTESQQKVQEVSEAVVVNSFVACSSESPYIESSPPSLTGHLDLPAVASTSSPTSVSLSVPRTSERSMENDLTMTSVFAQSAVPANLMISSGVEASIDDVSEQMTLASVVTDEGAIIAGDPLDFAAALNAQLGYDRIRTYAELQARREHEPRSVPLLFFQDETRRESFAASSGSGMNRTSTSGSESSIGNSVSEVGDDNGDASVSEGRDEAQRYFDTALRAAQCGSGPTEGGVVSSDGVGMDCMPLRPGPFHYLISEQAKSLVALQELQNEVGALLEFRDLVIETFPNLRHKMAASSSSSTVASVMSSSQTSSHIPLPLASPSSRRVSEWEPGKVRRRVPTREGESSASSLPRSRSNSHSGGSKNSATVQDSGFSTETSSKDSASTAIPRPASPRPVLDEAEDELWNLLDVIHRKGIRLREEVESLQGRLESVAPEELGISSDVLEAVRNVTGTVEAEDPERNDDARDNERKLRDPGNEKSPKEEAVQLNVLRREKEQLLDKVAELEAETISSRARAQELQTELAALAALRNGLEDRLRSVLETRNEILTPGTQRKQPSLVQTSTPITSPKGGGVNIRSSKSSAFATVVSSSSASSSGPSGKAHKNRFRTRTIEKNVLANGAVQPLELEVDPEVAAQERRIRLGALDSILISPTRVAHVGSVDRVKIAAILREHSSLELQRHLITSTVHNQCLQKRLDEVEKSGETLSERLDKAREENDDLRFQLEERNIELEGTRARVRVLERLQQRPPTEADPDGEPDSEPRCEPSCLEPGSSTESARDHHQATEMKPSPRRRPSRIPLPGSCSKPAAPKPPGASNKNDSRESLKSSLKSLTTRPPRDSSRDSNAGTKSSLSRGIARDSSRESLNKQSLQKSGGKEASRESLNRSLPRNNNSNRDSLNKSSSLSRARDSLESSNTPSNNNNVPPGTPPRRPPAPARRSQSLARVSVDTDTGKGFTTDPPSSWCSSTSSFRHSESSLYPDSLNQETTSATGSTRVEFILGSPTRRFRPNSAWPSRYFDSINSTAMAAESLMTDEFPLRRGEALAECDSLECHPISSEGWKLDDTLG